MKIMYTLIAISASIVVTVNANTLDSMSLNNATIKGLEIAIEADKRDSGWQDRSVVLEMTLRNAKGKESKRTLRNNALEVIGDGDKSLTLFDEPKDVSGTAFLSYTHPTTTDDQWIYLPALKRTKRIASSNKSGPFMGSEFAYEDISSQEVEKYSYRYLRDEVHDGQDCFVVERTPQYENSGYTRLVTWMDKKFYRTLKIEYYDRKDDPLKTLTFNGYQQYLGQYWRAKLMEMVNHQTKKSTTLEWRDYEFKKGLTDADFDRNTLKRRN